MILVVDDDADVRETLCEVLKDEGYEVAAARNGAEALHAIRQADHVCMVLLDLMMPVMSGYQFRNEQKADPSLAHIPVVVMSARWGGGGEIDATTFLPKPVGLSTVLSLAERYCNEQRRR